MKNMAAKLKNLTFRWGPAVLCMAAIFFLSSHPKLPKVPGLWELSFGDKIEHGIAYGVLGALIWRGLSKQRPKWWQIFATIVLSAAYGYSDEWHQSFVPGRSRDIMDLTADTVGSAIAAIILTTCIGGDKIGKRK